jgi:hypothetical protein
VDPRVRFVKFNLHDEVIINIIMSCKNYYNNLCDLNILHTVIPKN